MRQPIQAPTINTADASTLSMNFPTLRLEIPKNLDDPKVYKAARVKEVDLHKYEYKHKETNALF